MPDFADRSEYEKRKTEMVDRLRKEEQERRETWVCPECCSILPLSCLRCQCGYAAGESFLRYFRGDVTSSGLYEIVRNEFHAGDREKALLLSRYLVRRFPLAKEAEHLREYREPPRPDIRPATGLPGEHDSAPPANRRRTKTIIAATLACILSLILAFFFWEQFPKQSPGRGQGRHVSAVTGTPADDDRAAAEKMLQEKDEAEKSEAERLRSPQAQLGLKKGREIARTFLTNKPSQIREKCYQAMLQAGLRNTDYLVGCMTGYDSYGFIWRRPGEAADGGGPSPGR